jgi:hypothetical protein
MSINQVEHLISGNTVPHRCISKACGPSKSA